MAKYILPDPGKLTKWENSVGEVMLFDVVGQSEGRIFGTDTYTSDSDLAAAAVHAGVLRPGERGVVRVRIVPVLSSYRGSMRNGVESRSWDTSWSGAYQVEKA